MAAGLGTRLRPYTDYLPKPLVPIMGLPSIQFAIDLARDAGINRLITNSHHLDPIFKSGLKALEQYTGISVSVSDESELLLGSGGGVARAKNLLGTDAPFLLLNADVLTNVPLAQMMEFHTEQAQKNGTWITLAVKTNPKQNFNYREILLDPLSSQVTGLGEVRGNVPFYCGVAILDPAAIQGLEEDQPAEFVPKILWPAIQKKKVAFFEFKDTWIDIGDPNLWAQAHFEVMQLLSENRAPQRWTERLLHLNEEVRDGIWMAHSIIRGLENSSIRKWQGPIYWSTNPPWPHQVGGSTVVYGPCPSKDLLEKGGLISWNNLVSAIQLNEPFARGGV